MTMANKMIRIAVAALCAAAIPAQAAQTLYPTAEAASAAFIEAARNPTPENLTAVLGDDYKELGSGDPVADGEDLRMLVESAAEGTSIDPVDEKNAVVLIGEDDWPLPIPLVKEEAGWRFDSVGAKEELTNRHIGRDELHAVATLRAVVDAQKEYSAEEHAGGAFAQKFRSSDGQRDGLYWAVKEGEEPSPLGPLVAEAEEAGYQKTSEGVRTPYYGYYFRILTAQGAHAPGGKKEYLKEGRLAEGFAVMAFPADYGKSGIKSFIVNQRGIIFEKDLGAESVKLAEAMTAFDPDPTWEPVDDPTL